jgi:type IV pilus assembly protein PilV
MIANQTTSRSGSPGFTLIEVLMAMLIMTVGLMGLLQSVIVAYQHNARNRLREEALLVGEEQMSVFMNDFRQRTFDRMSSTQVLNLDRPIAGASKKFRVTKTIQGLGLDSKRLTVAVAWSFQNVSTTHIIYTMKNR